MYILLCYIFIIQLIYIYYYEFNLIEKCFLIPLNVGGLGLRQTNKYEKNSKAIV